MFDAALISYIVAEALSGFLVGTWLGFLTAEKAVDQAWMNGARVQAKDAEISRLKRAIEESKCKRGEGK